MRTATHSDATSSRTALLAGATGLIGSALLHRLLAAPDYARIRAITRRHLPLAAPRLHEHVVDFAALGALELDAPIDVAFCALGTTMRAAGSEEAFRRVDYDAIIAFAEIALRHRAQRFVLVSSVGADPQARNFYLRVKGETESAVSQLGFDAVDLVRPGLLLGRRQERRPLERAGGRIMRLVNPLFAGPFARYRAVEATDVAAAMIGAARRPAHGVTVHEGAAIMALARSTNPADSS